MVSLPCSVCGWEQPGGSVALVKCCDGFRAQPGALGQFHSQQLEVYQVRSPRRHTQGSP